MSKATPLVNNYGQTFIPAMKYSAMIDNYVYLHHTDTMIILPTFPETITDSTAVSFSATNILTRSAPIYSYSSSGPRSIDISLKLHRDMMHSINVQGSTLKNWTAEYGNIQRGDYLELLIKQLQAAALPRYGAAEKMVDPPLVTVRFGDEVYCTGVVEGSVSITYSGPILGNAIYDEAGNVQYDAAGNRLIGNGKYAEAAIQFHVQEVDPYDAEAVMLYGSLRGVRSTLDRNEFKRAR